MQNTRHLPNAPCRATHSRRNPNHHRSILALTTAFWDAYLRDDARGKAWLDGDGPEDSGERRSVAKEMRGRQNFSTVAVTYKN